MDIRNQKRFSVSQASEKTGMSEAWWRTQISEGRIRYIQIGERKFIPEETIRNVVKVVEPTALNSQLSTRVV